ncbi:MAG: hypothetical protein M3015_09725 [Bacteroidota bacterium]|nr:hypothetical protein [Bacteroidota bacterium]
MNSLKMQKSFSYLIFLLLVLCCCNQSVSSNEQLAAADTDSSSLNTVLKKDTVIGEDVTTDTTQTLFAGSDTLFAKMNIDGVKDHKILPVQIASGKILYAKLIPSAYKPVANAGQQP